MVTRETQLKVFIIHTETNVMSVENVADLPNHHME